MANYTTIKDIRNGFKLKKKLKQLKIEYLDILRIFFSMKKKKNITNQYEWVVFGVIVTLNVKVILIEIKHI